MGHTWAGRCVNRGLILASAKAGRRGACVTSGHTSCCHLPPQACRSDILVGKEAPVLPTQSCPRLQPSALIPRARAGLLWLPPSSSLSCSWPLRYYKGREGGAVPFCHTFCSLMASRMFSLSNPSPILPFSHSPRTENPAWPQHSINN